MKKKIQNRPTLAICARSVSRSENAKQLLKKKQYRYTS